MTTPWKCWIRAGSATLQRRPGAPPSGPPTQLILARTGEEPRTSGQTMRMLRRLRRQDSSLEPLRLGYGLRQSFLHDACFYDGILEPAEDIIRDVRETVEYISDAESMASG